MKRVLAILCVLGAPALAQPAPPAAPAQPAPPAAPARGQPAPSAVPAHGESTPPAPGYVVERSRVEVAPAGRGFKQLSIDNPLGNVRVEGYDGTAILIETHKRAPDEDTLDRLRVSLVPNPDGTVRITTTADGGREVRPVPRSAVRIDLVIRAPRNARVQAAAAAGKLEVDNMDAGGDLDTASGPISVRNVAGEVWTHSVSGSMSIEQVFGSVDAAAISADVELDTIGGEKLIASVHHGRIAGRRVRARDVELTTTEGRIALEAEAALHGHLIVSSLRGDIDVRLHRHGSVVVRARGRKVDLGGPATFPHATPRPGGWSEATIGQGEHPAIVELQSHYGTVRFVVLD